MNKELKERVWEVIFKSDTTSGKVFDVMLLITILISILAVALESVESINEPFRQYFRILEYVITGIFTLEYILRIYVVRRPRRYIFSFYGIIDFIAIIPTYLGLFLVGSQSLLVIRALRLLRIFRVLKLTRYTKAANTITSALRSSMMKISVFLFGVLTLVIIIGTIMYLIEGKENGFKDIPTSIYWAVVTLTTVGYGDIVPQTSLGQIISGFVMILGYGIIAVPTGIVTAQVISDQKIQERKKCPGCKNYNHLPDALFCQNCGHELK